jgi:hypothetical protein
MVKTKYRDTRKIDKLKKIIKNYETPEENNLILHVGHVTAFTLYLATSDYNGTKRIPLILSTPSPSA